MLLHWFMHPCFFEYLYKLKSVGNTIILIREHKLRSSWRNRNCLRDCTILTWTISSPFHFLLQVYWEGYMLELTTKNFLVWQLCGLVLDFCMCLRMWCKPNEHPLYDHSSSSTRSPLVWIYFVNQERNFWNKFVLTLYGWSLWWVGMV